MPRHLEPIIPERRHDIYLILGHAPLGVGFMPRIAAWLVAISVTAEIGRYDGEPVGQGRRQFAPHDMGLGITVQ